MIARAESGQARGNMDDFDAADVAQGIHELYEPLAEDNGLTLHVKTEPVPLHGNRELISQALANLVENAIKYGQPAPALQPNRATGAEAWRRQGYFDRSPPRRRPGAAQCHRSRPRHSGSRSRPRGRTVCAAGGKPHPAGFRAGLKFASAVATLHGGALRLSDAHPGLRATLAIPALSGASDRVAAQTPDVPQKVA